MGLFVIISYVVAASFDIYEKFHFWSRGYEAYNLDEAPVILFALALALLEKEKDIDLLFTDILMPSGMDGWELAQRARDMVPGLGFFTPRPIRKWRWKAGSREVARRAT